jgi:hypothetical protein
MACLALTVVSTVTATHDLHDLLEVVGIAHHHGPHHVDLDGPHHAASVH